MNSVPQIPKTDNPYELAMHAGNVRYYEQHTMNPRMDAINAAGTAICAEGLVALFIIGLAAFLVMQ
jgi:hypothetical protein